MFSSSLASLSPPLVASFDRMSQDVTDLVQRRIEQYGGGTVLYLAGRDADGVPEWAKAIGVDRDGDGDVDSDDGDALDDLNAIFGDPTPDQPKLLNIVYTVLGHDSDKQVRASSSLAPGCPPRRWWFPAAAAARLVCLSPSFFSLFLRTASVAARVFWFRPPPRLRPKFGRSRARGSNPRRPGGRPPRVRSGQARVLNETHNCAMMM